MDWEDITNQEDLKEWLEQATDDEFEMRREWCYEDLQKTRERIEEVTKEYPERTDVIQALEKHWRVMHEVCKDFSKENKSRIYSKEIKEFEMISEQMSEMIKLAKIKEEKVKKGGYISNAPNLSEDLCDSIITASIQKTIYFKEGITAPPRRRRI